VQVERYSNREVKYLHCRSHLYGIIINYMDMFPLIIGIIFGIIGDFKKELLEGIIGSSKSIMEGKEGSVIQP